MSWKDVQGYEGVYQVNKLGEIRSLDRHTKIGWRKGRVLKGVKGNNGYLRLTLCKNHIKKNFTVHRLVALTFIPNPDKLEQVNHINGIKSDNRVENLEWCTASENTYHAYKTGLTSKKGSKNNNAKLTEEKAENIRELLKEGMSQGKIADIMGVCSSTISLIKTGKIWRADG